LSDKLYPRVKIQVKASKYYSLHKEQKRYNKMLVSIRAMLKHLNGSAKYSEFKKNIIAGNKKP